VERVQIRFVKHSGMYAAGEVAMFPAPEAQAWLDRGFAVPTEEAEPEPTKKVVVPKPPKDKQIKR
jgi:hypothetical protein